MTPPDPLRVLCTGDWAAVDPEGGSPRYVREYLPRRTAFVRSTSSKRSEGQILAANVDHAIVAVSLAAELDLARVERFLALAWESGAQPLVVLTKADLVPDPVGLSYLVRDVEATAPGVPVLPVSAVTGDGVDVVRAVVAGGTSVLLGVSGAASPLANTLIGEDAMEVRATREVDGKGRHTTTTRNLFLLPWRRGPHRHTRSARGGPLGRRDRRRPGLRRDRGTGRAVPLPRLRPPGGAGLRGARRRRRRDAAAAAPESYRKLLRENQYIVAKTDARMRAEMRREWKRRGAEGRAAMEAKRGGGPRLR